MSAQNNGNTSTREILHAIFPAMLFGIIGLMMFVLFSAVYASAGGTSAFFANAGDMATLGFFVGFAGRLAPVFEKYINNQ